MASLKAYVVCDQHGKFFCADAGSDLTKEFCAGCGLGVAQVDTVADAQLYSSAERAQESCSAEDIVVEVSISVSASAGTRSGGSGSGDGSGGSGSGDGSSDSAAKTVRKRKITRAPAARANTRKVSKRK